MITRITTQDVRYPIGSGHGSDAIHRDPIYSYAVLNLHDDSGLTGVGLAFTLGEGNDLVCHAAEFLAASFLHTDIEDVMRDFGARQNALSNEQQFRWLGPHKGVVHLALASVTNACWDLWAKKRGVPLWRLLLDLTPAQLVKTLDLSYLEDVLLPAEAEKIVAEHFDSRSQREPILQRGYPGYDTSVGWFNYDDHQIRDNARRALDAGFTAMKLKVGSKDSSRDIRRADIIRGVVGDSVRLMVDANQQWTLPQALKVCAGLASVNPYWVEEPTHPDDVIGHQTLARAIAPIGVAAGEHVPNRVIFKNYLQCQALAFNQVDCVRVAGISEFLAISLLSRKFAVPVVPHVGDMGQIHQHLVLFNHVGLGLPEIFLEYIPHLREHFVHPAEVRDGVYGTPQIPGIGSDLKA